MAELNLKQIIDRLSAEFHKDTYKLIFSVPDKDLFGADILCFKFDSIQ